MRRCMIGWLLACTEPVFRQKPHFFRRVGNNYHSLRYRRGPTQLASRFARAPLTNVELVVRVELAAGIGLRFLSRNIHTQNTAQAVQKPCVLEFWTGDANG